MTAYQHLDGDSNIKSKKIGSEINLVIDARLPDITHGFEDGDRRKISQLLKDMENPTYLWLYLTFDDIERIGCESRSDVEDLMSALSDEVSYKNEKILDRSVNQTETGILFQIVPAAVRPLTVNEANIALKLASHKEQSASHRALQSDLLPREISQENSEDFAASSSVSMTRSCLSFTRQLRSFLHILNLKGNGKGA